MACTRKSAAGIRTIDRARSPATLDSLDRLGIGDEPLPRFHHVLAHDREIEDLADLQRVLAVLRD